ncbi:MAG: glutamine--tRNA ligase, partial [Chthoniobacteraceae bacterium]
MSQPDAAPTPSDFIRDIVAADLASGKVQRVVTRFPPEPNGYLHIGHAKSICLNFGIAHEFGGRCNLRMDDTNPAKEDVEYVDSIIGDVRWLIGGWADQELRFKTEGEPFYASDYFQQLHDYAVLLIQAGKAYVCDLTAEQTDAYRGAPGEPGKPSPFRDRSVAENLGLFARMKAGEFPDGARTLRAKIDMAHPNVWLRDPLLYRIRHTAHHHTGDAWCLYPLYDYAHCLSDSIEGVTHSICTLEFEVHRPLYDWIIDALPVPQPRPHQYEFAKLMPTHMVISKRKLLAFVNENIVSGWDDPRMPTLSGLRRRGITPEAVRQFAYNIGVTKYQSSTDIAVFEHAIRSDLNARALRRLAVLRPLKVVITNFPE